MLRSLQVPTEEDLAELPVEVLPGSEPGVCTITAVVGDGGEVSVTWDELASSVTVRWRSGGKERLVVERETATLVTIREERDQVVLHVRSEADELTGDLVIAVGADVTVADTLLRG